MLTCAEPLSKGRLRWMSVVKDAPPCSSYEKSYTTSVPLRASLLSREFLRLKSLTSFTMFLGISLCAFLVNLLWRPFVVYWLSFLGRLILYIFSVKNLEFNSLAFILRVLQSVLWFSLSLKPALNQCSKCSICAICLRLGDTDLTLVTRRRKKK